MPTNHTTPSNHIQAEESEDDDDSSDDDSIDGSGNDGSNGNWNVGQGEEDIGFFLLSLNKLVLRKDNFWHSHVAENMKEHFVETQVHLANMAGNHLDFNHDKDDDDDNNKQGAFIQTRMAPMIDQMCDIAGTDHALQDYLMEQLGVCRTDAMKMAMERQMKSTQEAVLAGNVASPPVRNLSTNPHRTKRKTSPTKKCSSTSRGEHSGCQ
jgi:hypothetical protein